MAAIRKTVILSETILSEMGRGLAAPIVRVAGMAVIVNPFAGKFQQDLNPLYEVGREVGFKLASELSSKLGRPAVAYGKGALVGTAGEMEHGGACIHPMLGKPMRGAIGGGKALIPSNVKVASPGTALDVPLGHKDDIWSFDHFDTMTIFLADAPRADEIVVVLAFADGGRPIPRSGQGPM